VGLRRDHGQPWRTRLLGRTARLWRYHHRTLHAVANRLVGILTAVLVTAPATMKASPGATAPHASLDSCHRGMSSPTRVVPLGRHLADGVPITSKRGIPLASSRLGNILARTLGRDRGVHVRTRRVQPPTHGGTGIRLDVLGGASTGNPIASEEELVRSATTPRGPVPRGSGPRVRTRVLTRRDGQARRSCCTVSPIEDHSRSS
jgi:hypothetical protein